MKLPENQIICGENIKVMRNWPDNCVPTIICDPPYGLSFMGKKWDYQVPSIEEWQECLRVLKPGGTLLCFAGSRTQHRMACNVEDAGFILKDCIMWLYGSGFPKATDISKQLDKRPLADIKAFSIALKKRRLELNLTVTQADKLITGGTTMYSFLEGREGYGTYPPNLEYWNKIKEHFGMAKWSGIIENNLKVTGIEDGNYGYQKNGERWDNKREIKTTTTPEAQLWNGWKSHGLKPAYEPILVAMKPNDGTYAENALKWGVSGLWIDGGRIPLQGQKKTTGGCKGNRSGRVGYFVTNKDPNIKEDNSQGRFPANIILDDNYIPILCLTNTGDIGIIQAIKEFFYDYELPNVPKRVQGISKSSQERSSEVLQQSLLSQSTVKTNGRKKASNVRQETQAGIYTEDEAKTDKAGKGESSLQRKLYGEGLSLHQSPRTKSGRTGNSEADDNKRFDTRTPTCNVDEIRQTIKTVRASASPERNQGRQQARESRSLDEHNPQDEPQADITGTSETAKRERRIEVLDCDIPNQWLKYFEPTGYEIRDPNCAGVMLDEQTKGKLHKAGNKKPAKMNDGSGMFGSGKAFNAEVNYNDFDGGASRFFYCAKASKRERNAGCEGLPLGEPPAIARGNSAEGRNAPLGEPRANHHPTVKPLALMEYLCNLTKTPAGGIVLDPYCGSGTTCKAAQNTGRNFIGIDKNPEYCEIARQRLEAVDTGVPVKEQRKGQGALFPEKKI